MSLAFEIRLVILRVAGSAKQFKTSGVVAPTLAHGITMMYIQSATLSAAALATMAGPGEYLADGGIGNGRTFGRGNTCGSGW